MDAGNGALVYKRQLCIRYLFGIWRILFWNGIFAFESEYKVDLWGVVYYVYYVNKN